MSEVITLDFNSEPVKYLCQRDKRLAKVISLVGTITYTPHGNSYRFLIKTILGQMLSNKVANIIYQRLEELCNGSITTVAINNLTDAQLKSIGTSNSKVAYIRDLTTTVESEKVDFEAFSKMSDVEIIKKLTAIHGIGKWSAKMYLIFVLNRQDVLPFEDIAFLQGYGWAYKTNDYVPAVVSAKCKKWKPYSSIAARFLYRALDNGLTKEEFHLYK